MLDAKSQGTPAAGFRQSLKAITRLIDRMATPILPTLLVALLGSATINVPAAHADDSVAAGSGQPDAEGIRFFESKIRPVLIESCYDCHSEDEQESDLRVDTLEGMLTGGLAGASVVPGKPKSSLMLTAILYHDSDLRMPPDEKLSDSQIADVTRWIEMGAPHPDSANVKPIKRRGDIDIELGRKHWAFQPPVKVDPPRVAAASTADSGSGSQSDRSRNPIDAFILSRLEKEGLQRVAAADKATLIRRATFDLIGLPPTPAEIEAFIADDSPDAFRHVVDRLLASPHYGERWGRHWLDIARYADSNGLDENVAHGNAWRYRDYVVNALNNDKPYDEFVVEQLAGDLLDSGTDVALKNERLIATGYLVLGPKVLAEPDQAKMEMDIIDEQLDTIGRSIMGLTIGCARCHTHKFDPISHHDYYGLAGIFKSTHTMDSYKTVAKWHETAIETPEDVARREAHEQRVAAQQKLIAERVADATAKLDPAPAAETKPEEVEKLFPAETLTALKELRDELKKIQDAAPEMPMAMGVVEGTVADTSVHLRGSHLTLGDVVPRRFPEVLADDNQSPLPAEQSGRLEFARWLTSGTHPLTARVMVNRIWRGHFGKGIVTTVDNFGVQGNAPSHPELLDWLAVRFVEEGWSIKAMHRMIMLSETYQTSSTFDAHNNDVDPGNQFYWRYNLRRLEAEAIRDGLLAVSGTLDRTTGGNIMQYKTREYIFNHTSEDKSEYVTSRRSIYVPVIRNHLYDMFQLFDYTDASVLTGDRNTSTIAPQALFMMNSELIDELTFAIADRLLQIDTDLPTRINRLYLESYGRPASPEELSSATAFLSQFQTMVAKRSDKMDPQRLAWQAFCQSVVSSNEFVYLR
ncbi:Planctomycete cytochrome C [Novipirellula galeiformis]|uniref:Planctomycete cytochrome C n=1 Tax=Novipirellula galeiformis TaxID=2528004 RepID=A0A5C6BY42_9BACT|nr:PSD1 and planctomycete cytochrome C domain-containing protein [Novipirellula galeiformis]TWU17223.1 Planctomycete cytochrome C [Novipirellula galeiformis]